MVKNELQFSNDWKKCEELYWKLHKLKLCKDAFEGLWKEEKEEGGVLRNSKHYYVWSSSKSLETEIQSFAKEFNDIITDYVMGEES